MAAISSSVGMALADGEGGHSCGGAVERDGFCGGGRLSVVARA